MKCLWFIGELNIKATLKLLNFSLKFEGGGRTDRLGTLKEVQNKNILYSLNSRNNFEKYWGKIHNWASGNIWRLNLKFVCNNIMIDSINN